jgi:PTS system nitrogen regulatory IIA component
MQDLGWTREGTAWMHDRSFPVRLPRGLLTPERVQLGLRMASLPELFDHLGRRIHPQSAARAGEAARRLGSRHARSSTALGDGVMLPHAELRFLQRPAAFFLRLAQPLAVAAPDHEPVADVLALVVPRPATAAHHGLLSALMQLLTTPGFRRGLRVCADAESVLELFSLWVQR